MNAMDIRKSTQPKKELHDFFTPEKTQQFLVDMDQAIKKLDFHPIYNVLRKYGIIENQDAQEFGDAYLELMHKLHRHDKGSAVVTNVSKRKSRCIACEFGKDMTVYEFEYRFPEADSAWCTVIYRYDLGILYDIREGVLHNLKICNAFLTHQEMEAI
jgi:hypothetical protein